MKVKLRQGRLNLGALTHLGLVGPDFEGVDYLRSVGGILALRFKSEHQELQYFKPPAEYPAERTLPTVDDGALFVLYEGVYYSDWLVADEPGEA